MPSEKEIEAATKEYLRLRYEVKNKLKVPEIIKAALEAAEKVREEK